MAREALLAKHFGGGSTDMTGNWAGNLLARFGLRFYIKSVPLSWHRDWGPVAQGIEQQPSKLKVAGSNPAGVTIIVLISFNNYDTHLLLSLPFFLESPLDRPWYK